MPEIFSTEDLNKFPSAFQLARNLAVQAWESGKGVLEGKKLLASADNAFSRLKICEACEFYKDTRCLKCGCFMGAKTHLEAASCPVGKWGNRLNASLTSPNPVAFPLFSKEEKEQYNILVETAKRTNNKSFDFKGKRFTVTVLGPGRTQISVSNIS